MSTQYTLLEKTMLIIEKRNDNNTLFLNALFIIDIFHKKSTLFFIKKKSNQFIKELD